MGWNGNGLHHHPHFLPKARRKAWEYVSPSLSPELWGFPPCLLTHHGWTDHVTSSPFVGSNFMCPRRQLRSSPCSVTGLTLYAAGSGENAQLLGSLYTYSQPCRQGPHVCSLSGSEGCVYQIQQGVYYPLSQTPRSPASQKNAGAGRVLVHCERILYSLCRRHSVDICWMRRAFPMCLDNHRGTPLFGELGDGYNGWGVVSLTARPYLGMHLAAFTYTPLRHVRDAAGSVGHSTQNPRSHDAALLGRTLESKVPCSRSSASQLCHFHELYYQVCTARYPVDNGNCNFPPTTWVSVDWPRKPSVQYVVAHAPNRGSKWVANEQSASDVGSIQYRVV